MVSVAYTPPPLPLKLCAEVAWEIIHTPVLTEEDKRKVLSNLRRRCGQNFLDPVIMAPTGWPLNQK